MIRFSPRALARLLTLTIAAGVMALLFAPSAYAQSAKPSPAPAPGAKPDVKSDVGAAAAKPAPRPSTSLVDINRASAAELETIPGIGKAYAARIIAARPYANKAQLVQKGILTQGLYDKIKGRLIARQ